MTYDPFLPENYSEPTNSDYVKLSEGTHKLRFLQSPVLVATKREDYLDEKGKDKRKCTRKKLSTPAELEKGWKLAWLCVVYNYQDQSVQIWEISQKNIRGQIATLCNDEDFGNPLAYDIKVTRSGKTQNDTSYTVQGLGKSEVSEEVANAWSNVTVDFDRFISEGESAFVTDNTTTDSPF